jgi:hypothetical protein
MKTLRLCLLATMALAIAASVAQRLWLQYRPLPVTLCVQRPMTQVEWEARAGTNVPMPPNFSMIDEAPYTASAHAALVSSRDIRKIRALASWGAALPFRTVRIHVWSSTNVTLAAYERHTMELAFTKDASGWHMERVGGQIDWASEDAKPILSFH